LANAGPRPRRVITIAFGDATAELTMPAPTRLPKPDTKTVAGCYVGIMRVVQKVTASSGKPDADEEPYRLGVVVSGTLAGAQVLQVVPGGLGRKMGLKPGDLIVGINGQRVTSRDSYLELLNDCGGEAKVTVRSASPRSVTHWNVSWLKSPPT